MNCCVGGIIGKVGMGVLILMFFLSMIIKIRFVYYIYRIRMLFDDCYLGVLEFRYCLCVDWLDYWELKIEGIKI